MRKPIISLHGSYFGNNYGDILLEIIFARWVREQFPNSLINLPLGRKSKATDLDVDRTGLINLCKSSALIFFGGGYFGERPHHKHRWAIRNFFRHAIIGIIAIIFRIPYAIIGVEFGPISVSWFKKICLLIAKHARVVVVRNPESETFLKDNGIVNAIVSVDAVLSISDLYPPKSNKSMDKNIVIHCNGVHCTQQTLQYVIDTMITSLSYHFAKFHVTFVMDSSGCNYYQQPYFSPILRLLESRGIRYEVYEYSNCAGIINCVQEADFVITTKLHLGITAAALDKRVLSLWLHNKTPRLHKQIGNSQFCVPLSSLPDGMDELWDKFFSSSEYHLPQNIKDQAYINKTTVITFLSNVL